MNLNTEELATMRKHLETELDELEAVAKSLAPRRKQLRAAIKALDTLDALNSPTRGLDHDCLFCDQRFASPQARGAHMRLRHDAAKVEGEWVPAAGGSAGMFGQTS